MRALLVVAVLSSVAPGVARAQAAAPRPTEKLLMLPLPVAGGADSVISVQVMDAAREKVASLARYKVSVIPKPKICEALEASGFPCDILMDEQQTRQLARFLSVDAFTTGTLARSGGALTANVRVVDVGGSGFAYQFSVNNGNPATAGGLGEAIATRLNTIIRAAEQARECDEQRRRGAFTRALESARKATQTDPNLPAAHLCAMLVHEAQRMPPDSIIAAARRALRGDSLNATAWERIAQMANVKGDTALMVDARRHQLKGEPQNTPLRLGLVQLLFQMKQHQAAVDLLDEGLSRNPGDQAMLDRKLQICIEGGLWRCTLDGLIIQAQRDSTRWADTSFLKTGLGAAQQLSDTQAMLRFATEGTRRFPSYEPFWKALGAGYELAGKSDSAIAAYRRALIINPSDLGGALLVAKAIVEGAAYDTAAARTCRGDTACVSALRRAYADRLDTARVYIDRALASRDTGMVLSAAVITLTAGSRLAQAQAYDRAYPWLEQTLTAVALRSPADTVGPRQQVRVNASFWYGLASVQTLGPPFKGMVDSKSCSQAAQINERLARTHAALERGRRVHEGTAAQLLGNLKRYEDLMPKVKQAYKCRTF